MSDSEADSDDTLASIDNEQALAPPNVHAHFRRTASTEVKVHDHVHFERGPTAGSYVIEDYIELHNDAHIAYMARTHSRLEAHNAFALAVRNAFQDAHWTVQCLCIFASAFLTHAYANRGEKVGNNLAQATVVTLGCQAMPHLGAPIAMGAYLGVASEAAVPGWAWLALLCLGGSGSWMLVHSCKLMVGFGGRLGITAFLTCNLLELVVVMPSGAVPWSRYVSTGQLWGALDSWQVVLTALVSPAVIAVLAKLFRDMGRSLENPIAGATTASLIGFLILSVSEWEYATVAMNGVGVGSFVGMAAAQHLGHSTLAFAVAGVAAGAVTLAAEPFAAGWSGKQGACSFVGFVVTAAFLKLGRAVAGCCSRTSKGKSREPGE